MTTWSLEDAGDQTGRVAVVTGANAGLGLETVRGLAGLGATVVLAVRRPDAGEAARAEIEAAQPDARLEVMPLDLGSLESIRHFAEAFQGTHDRLDLLINNAGIMMTPYGKTADGFELQLGVNFLGHFLLTGLLLPELEATPGSRVVALASNAHKGGTIRLGDLQSEQSYSKLGAYNQSKLACLMHALELQRRLTDKGSHVLSVAAHPGGSATNLFQHMPGFLQWLVPMFTQSAADGALPTLYAALGADIEGGDYTGPSGMLQLTGPPRKVSPAARGLDEQVASDLWEVAEQLVGITYP